MASPAVSLNARRAYAELISGTGARPWWNAVVLTASSPRQADRYMDEIRRRQHQGKIPPALYLAVPDTGGRRIGSGGATLNALRELEGKLARNLGDSRVLIIHSGGDSRRLPQYSLSGKLFGALPVTTVWGEVSTVFDEFLALSSSWAERLPSRAGGRVGRCRTHVRFRAASTGRGLALPASRCASPSMSDRSTASTSPIPKAEYTRSCKSPRPPRYPRPAAYCPADW